jgi:hypothetical protein
MSFVKFSFLAAILTFSSAIFALENGDMLNVSLVKNLNSTVDVTGVKYASQAGYSENYEFDMGGAGLGISVEYLARLTKLDGKKIFKDLEHAYFLNFGLEYNFSREGDKGTYTFSDGSSGAIADNLLGATEITPVNISLGFNTLVNNLVMIHFGLAYSILGYESTYDSGSGTTSATESEGTLAFQVGLGFVYDNFTAKLIYRPTTYDLDGTAVISGDGTTVEGEIEYNQTMLSLGYLF